jgi:glycosyltransferase involved in cell wall biosynthesis
LENAFGEAVIPMDVDMQDPPELIPQLVQKWQEGFEVVLAGRKNRDSDTFFKKTTASMFYWLVNKLVEIDIPSNVGDYRLMDQKVIKALRKLPERTRFMKGLFAWLGFRQTTVYYTRANRLAGQTKFKFWKLWNLALEGFFSFTAIPLKLWTYLGFLIAFFSMAYMVFIVATTLIFGNNVPGYASLMVFILFFNGLNMMGLGVLGEYLARTFVESKQRPLYLIRQKTGFDKAS